MWSKESLMQTRTYFSGLIIILDPFKKFRAVHEFVYIQEF